MLLTGYTAFSCEEFTQILSTEGLDICELVQKNNLENFSAVTIITADCTVVSDSLQPHGL